MIFHVLLLAMIISWKPPPIGQVARPIEVALVAGEGRAPTALFSPTPTPVEPKTIPTPVKPSVAVQATASLGSSPLPKPKPEPLKNLPSITDIAAGGPSLTAAPISISSTQVQAAPVSVQSAGGKNCQILETLKLGLQDSGAVKAALSLIPARSLSVAKAIVLWDGRWIDASSVGGPADLEPIEQAVSQIVGRAPPNCQLEAIQGVRFITLGDARDTTVLAFGSNAWSWADVVATLSPTMQK